MLAAFGSSGDTKKASARIFVIEDDLDHQKIAELTLRAAGIQQIQFFSTGEEAMEYFVHMTPTQTGASNIIFIDLMLPHIGGLEILKRLRMDDHWKASRMVVLTCSTDKNDRVLSQELGADDFLTKPLRSEYVRKILAS
jgi:DNA-binding response OmpR family regulator